MAVFQIQCDLTYQVTESSTFWLSLSPWCSEGAQRCISESLLVKPTLEAKRLSDLPAQKNYWLIEQSSPGLLDIHYEAVVESTAIVLPSSSLTAAPSGNVPVSVLPYLLPSRYCQSDKLLDFAQRHFGQEKNPYFQVMAIRKWIYEHMLYKSGYSTGHTSALDSLIELIGVCRDFSHVGIALCRALDIPARYLSAYAYLLVPPDFHACFEVYIGGKWLVIDATRLAPLNGLVGICHGMDAADAAVATIFGNAELKCMDVSVSVEEPDVFIPMDATEEVAYLLRG